jgi:trk system potassium uptake protein TrkA
VHFIVVGCGRVGSELARGLTSAEHTVSIIDKRRSAFARLPSDFPGQTITGLGFDRDALETAGIRRADAFAAVTSGDNSNIMAARIARETFEVRNVVARIYDPRRAVIYERLGIPTVATVAWTTEQVRRRLIPATASEWTDPTGALNLVERALPATWAGHPLAALDGGDRIRLISVTRGGRARMADDKLIGQQDDIIHVLVRDDARDVLESRLASGPEEA